MTIQKIYIDVPRQGGRYLHYLSKMFLFADYERTIHSAADRTVAHIGAVGVSDRIRQRFRRRGRFYK